MNTNGVYENNWGNAVAVWNCVVVYWWIINTQKTYLWSGRTIKPPLCELLRLRLKPYSYFWCITNFVHNHYVTKFNVYILQLACQSRCKYLTKSARHNFFTHAEEKNSAVILVAQCYRNITEKVNKFCKLTSTTRNLFIQARDLR